MPQPKSSGGRSSGRSKPRSEGSKSSRKSTAAGPNQSRSGGGSSSRKSGGSAAAPTRRGRRAGRARPRPSPALAQPPGEETLWLTLANLRDRLARGIVITGERLQETVDDAVSRGRLTRDDAEELVQRLLATGRKQREELLAELEKGFERSRKDLLNPGVLTRLQTRPPGSDRVLREVDRARRAVGIGPSFPILGYDDLAAAQITGRLADLNSAQLRKVRDYERKHGNRKSVLDAIEKLLK